MTSTVAAQRQVAAEMVATLRCSATVGALFELLRPMGFAGRTRHDRAHTITDMFLNRAAHVLLHLTGEEILAWAEYDAEPPRLHLHRAVT